MKQYIQDSKGFISVETIIVTGLVAFLLAHVIVLVAPTVSGFSAIVLWLLIGILALIPTVYWVSVLMDHLRYKAQEKKYAEKIVPVCTDVTPKEDTFPPTEHSSLREDIHRLMGQLRQKEGEVLFERLSRIDDTLRALEPYEQKMGMEVHHLVTETLQADMLRLVELYRTLEEDDASLYRQRVENGLQKIEEKLESVLRSVQEKKEREIEKVLLVIEKRYDESSL